MSSSDFRQLALRGEAGKAERLFRAAVSAFCSLTRPSRREIAQLEDLTLPLFEQVSVESRRYVAAALSECESAPEALVRRLCDEPVDIAAPLLIRSGALTDIDLIALIGRHGLKHARAIARRPNLNATIAQLVAALDGPRLVRSQPDGPPPTAPDIPDDREPGRDRRRTTPVSGSAAEDARRKLRWMMFPAPGRTASPSGSGAYAKLRGAALSGSAALFQTALADSLKVDMATSEALTRASDYAWLLIGLRALDIGDEQAFLLVAATFPGHFAHPEGIRLFLERYDAVDVGTATDKVRNWKLDAIARAVEQRADRSRPDPATLSPSNSDSVDSARFKAS